MSGLARFLRIPRRPSSAQKLAEKREIQYQIDASRAGAICPGCGQIDWRNLTDGVCMKCAMKEYCKCAN